MSRILRDKINESIFRSYDIRGLYPEEINKETAYLIGKAYICWLNSKSKILNSKILVSCDMRDSSPELSEALVRGLTESGADVIDIGLSTTPMHYFGINFLNTDGGIMVTASHNPAEYNGFKVSLAKAVPVGKDSGLEEIKKIALDEKETVVNDIGMVAQKDILEDYVDFLTKNRKINKNLKLVVDAGNGMAGFVLPKIFEKLGIQNYEPLYFDLNGNFPNHEANPLKEETLTELKKKVLENKADLGIAFDGDGDRVGFVTSNGEAARGDYIIALIAGLLLEKKSGEKIIYDVRSSRSVSEFIERKDGIPLRGKVGHSYMKERLRGEGILFGGELSMHYYFQEFFNCDSGELAMIKILELLSESGKSLTELVLPLKRYFQSGELNFNVADKEAKIKEIENKFSGGKIDYLDGLTVEYPDWWFNLRASGTEPLLRLNIEANTIKLLGEKRELLTETIK